MHLVCPHFVGFQDTQRLSIFRNPFFWYYPAYIVSISTFLTVIQFCNTKQLCLWQFLVTSAGRKDSKTGLLLIIPLGNKVKKSSPSSAGVHWKMGKCLKAQHFYCFFVKYLHCLFIKFTAQDLPCLSQEVQYESLSAEHIRHFSSADSFMIFCVSKHSAGQQSDTINMHRTNVVWSRQQRSPCFHTVPTHPPRPCLSLRLWLFLCCRLSVNKLHLGPMCSAFKNLPPPAPQRHLSPPIQTIPPSRSRSPSATSIAYHPRPESRSSFLARNLVSLAKCPASLPRSIHG